MDWHYLIETFFKTAKGIPNTLIITFASLLIAAPGAFFLAWVQLNEIPVAKRFVRLYLALIRATPLILLILIFYSVIPSLINQWFKKAAISFDIFTINPLYLAITVFTIITMGSLSEVFRSAISSVQDGQYEAGLSSGLSPSQIYRRIIFPQAFAHALPPLANLTITIVKGTSLVFIMTVQDITAIAKVEASYGYRYTESYLVIFILYIVICSIIQWGFSRLESQFKWEKSSLSSINQSFIKQLFLMKRKEEFHVKNQKYS